MALFITILVLWAGNMVFVWRCVILHERHEAERRLMRHQFASSVILKRAAPRARIDATRVERN